MFNDELSLDECRALVSRLVECKFPFQCAHGRYVNAANSCLLAFSPYLL
jgi:DNA mismatch repair ATPase MutL